MARRPWQPVRGQQVRGPWQPVRGQQVRGRWQLVRGPWLLVHGQPVRGLWQPVLVVASCFVGLLPGCLPASWACLLAAYSPRLGKAYPCSDPRVASMLVGPLQPPGCWWNCCSHPWRLQSLQPHPTSFQPSLCLGSEAVLACPCSQASHGTKHVPGPNRTTPIRLCSCRSGTRLVQPSTSLQLQPPRS